MQSLDVLVIGAGQAGLALGYHLSHMPLRFRLIERNPRIGDSWRNRYDSLVLFTPRAYSALPSLAVPGDPEGYPTKDELADYLEAYASHFALPITLGTGIRRLETIVGGYRATTEDGATFDCCAVVVATGAFQQPAIPLLARAFSPEVAQFSPVTYKNPEQVPPGRVVVVGDGASGRQIALELAASHQVVLATSGRREPNPGRILGKSIFWWMERLGLLLTGHETRLGRYLMRADPFPGKQLRLPKLRAAGITVVGRLTAVDGKHVVFAGGERIAINTVIWATGYREQTDWLAIPEAKDAQGMILHQHGVSPVAGLYFIGRNWQRTHGSSRLYGVGADAAFVADHLATYVLGIPEMSVETVGRQAYASEQLAP